MVYSLGYNSSKFGKQMGMVKQKFSVYICVVASPFDCLLCQKIIVTPLL